MFQVKYIADLAAVSPTTIRTWAADFADFLSDGANPPRGQERRFSAEDVEILVTIARLREERQPVEQIRASLADGVRIHPAGPAMDEESEESRSLVARLTATVARYEGELSQVTAERDYLRGQLDEEREARLEAERQAAHLGGRLEVLEARPRRPSWWPWGKN